MGDSTFLGWLLFLVEITELLIIAFAIFCYFHRYRRLDKKLDKVDNTIDSIHKQFETHFKVTDETIKDLRKERDEYKKVSPFVSK